MRSLSGSAMAVLACALTSVVAVAQTRPATPPRPNRGAPSASTLGDSQTPMRRFGPGFVRSGPAGGPVDQLLRMRQQLELSDEQVTKLQGLRNTPRPRLNEAEMLRARADLLEATNGDINPEKARAAYEKMARLRTDVEVAQLRSRQDVRNVLTATQRTKLDAFASNGRGRRGDAMRSRGAQMRGAARGAAFGPPRGAASRGRPGMAAPRGGRRGMMMPGAAPRMGPDGDGARGMRSPRGPNRGMPARPMPPSTPPSTPPRPPTDALPPTG